MNNNIYNIDAKLQELRLRWKQGSPAMRKWIEQGARLLKKQKETLIKTAARRSEASTIDLY